MAVWIVTVIASMVVAYCLWSRRKMLGQWAKDVASLRLSEERYRILFNQTPKSVYAFDLETRSFVEVNEAALRHYGYLRHEFLSLTADGIRPPEEMRLMLERLASGTQTTCL